MLLNNENIEAANIRCLLCKISKTILWRYVYHDTENVLSSALEKGWLDYRRCRLDNSAGKIMEESKTLESYNLHEGKKKSMDLFLPSFLCVLMS